MSILWANLLQICRKDLCGLQQKLSSVKRELRHLCFDHHHLLMLQPPTARIHLRWKLLGDQAQQFLHS